MMNLLAVALSCFLLPTQAACTPPRAEYGYSDLATTDGRMDVTVPGFGPEAFRMLFGEPEKPKEPKLARPSDLAKGAKWVPWIRYSKEFDDEATEQLIAHIQEANEGDASALLIEFDSPGGDVSSGWNVMRAIEHSKVPVHCIVDGEAASMTFLTVQSCKDRMMTKRSVMMAHEIGVGGGFSGNPNNWQAVADMMKARQAAVVEQYVRRMKCSAEEMQRRIEGGKQWWMGWKEAYDRKAVDMVVSSAEDAQAAYAKGDKPKNLAK